MFPNDTRVLVVDDSDIARRQIVTHLTELGFANFIEADSGEAAIKALSESLRQKIPVDLVISDLNMPGISGADLVAQVRATPEYANLPVLIVSVNSDRISIVDAVIKGSSSYLMKPVTTEKLKKKLEFVQKKVVGY